MLPILDRGILLHHRAILDIHSTRLSSSSKDTLGTPLSRHNQASSLQTTTLHRVDPSGDKNKNWEENTSMMKRKTHIF
jgi:hypothetical protein